MMIVKPTILVIPVLRHILSDLQRALGAVDVGDIDVGVEHRLFQLAVVPKQAIRQDRNPQRILGGSGDRPCTLGAIACDRRRVGRKL